jgi:coronin-1B/1C/6
VLFNPAAENVLASASGDFTIKLWDIEAGSAKLILKLGDIVQSLCWSPDGSLLVTTSRDKKLRVWDVRQQRPAQEVQSHAGAKNSRAVWLGEHARIATTGFSRMSDRQLALWDIKAAREPIGGFQMLDSISGVCMPFWDDGTQCLYLAGKGDGNIRYYEYENDKFEYLSEYKSADPQRGVAFVPKRGVNMHDNEVMRAYKTVNDNYIEPISFIVPRRAETFQEDIYPPAVGSSPAMSSGDWFGGQTALPPKVDMETIYEGGGMKEIPPDAKPVIETPQFAKAPEPAKTESEPQPMKEDPLPNVSHVPPPSMKEQGSSMMAMADKFVDKNGDKEESSDESFEDVQRQMERAAVKPAPEDVKSEESKETTSELWKAKEDTGRGPGPSVLDEVCPDGILTLQGETLTLTSQRRLLRQKPPLYARVLQRLQTQQLVHQTVV